VATTNELGQPVGSALAVAVPDAPPDTTMAGVYCDLRRLDVEAHAADLYASYAEASDAGDWTYLPYGPFSSLDSFVDWLRTVENADDPMFFAVIDRESDAAVGLASYLRINPAACSIEVGHIHFSRRLQQRPAATEAMYLMMKRAFDSGYRRYEWKCDDLNAPSRAAAARLGFAYEGTFRQATHYKGRNRDTAWFGVIDSDWPRIDAAFRAWLDPANFDAGGAQLSSLAARAD